MKDLEGGAEGRGEERPAAETHPSNARPLSEHQYHIEVVRNLTTTTARHIAELLEK